MQRFYDILDKGLTAVLLTLVVAMVLSITSEILLNAIIQPVTSSLLKSCRDETLDSQQFEKEKSFPVSQLESVMGFVANASSPVNTASQTLLVWIGILGSALAFRLRAHLGVDALVRLYPRKVRLALDYISTALVGLFSFFIFVIGGYMVCYRAFSMGSKMPGFEILNRGWFYLVLILTGLLNLLYSIYHFSHPSPVGGLDPPKEERTRT